MHAIILGSQMLQEDTFDSFVIASNNYTIYETMPTTY